MSARQIVYLLLAAVGLVLTWHHNLALVAETGSLDVRNFIDGMFANHAAASIGWDITVTGVAFLIWVQGESRRLGMRFWGLWVVLTLGVALAVAAPLFLFARERKLAALGA